MNICKYRRCSDAEMKCHRLRAFHANLLEISVWESSDEKHLPGRCAKLDVRVADRIHIKECRVIRTLK